MQAVILAAGVGRRMKNLVDEKGDRPKCLLRVDGETLLSRHLTILSEVGVKNIHLVVGYRNEDVLTEAQSVNQKNSLGLTISHTMNDRFEEGSIISMYVAADQMAKEHSILMDADVLYPASLLKQLVESKRDNCFLLDTSAGASDEEMRLGADNGRILTIKRGLPGGYAVIGEGVGFLKITAEASKELMVHAKKRIEAGSVGDYEDAINDFLSTTDQYVGYELVDAPWMEIDFEEDVKKARSEVIGAIRAIEGE